MKIASRRLTSNKKQLPSSNIKLKSNFDISKIFQNENCKEQDLQRTKSNFLHLLLSFRNLTKFLYKIRTLETISYRLTFYFTSISNFHNIKLALK